MRPEKLRDFSKSTGNCPSARQWFDNQENPEGEHLIVAQGGNCPSARQWFDNLWKPWGGASHSCERPKLPLRLPLFGPAEKIRASCGDVIIWQCVWYLYREASGDIWCWCLYVTLISNTCDFHFAWPGGVREGRAAFATLSASPRRFSHISKYEQVLRNYPENPNMNRFPGSILRKKRYIRFPSYKKE